MIWDCSSRFHVCTSSRARTCDHLLPSQSEYKGHRSPLMLNKWHFELIIFMSMSNEKVEGNSQLRISRAGFEPASPPASGTVVILTVSPPRRYFFSADIFDIMLLSTPVQKRTANHQWHMRIAWLAWRYMWLNHLVNRPILIPFHHVSSPKSSTRSSALDSSYY
jgi:hypothetical protein